MLVLQIELDILQLSLVNGTILICYLQQRQIAGKLPCLYNSFGDLCLIVKDQSFIRASNYKRGMCQLVGLENSS